MTVQELGLYAFLSSLRRAAEAYMAILHPRPDAKKGKGGKENAGP